MRLIQVNPNNAIYYSEDFVKGFECGAKRQLEADRRSIPKGHWDFAGDNMFRCTECGAMYTYSQLERLKIYTTDNTFPSYCPRCGADMRGEANDKI